MYQRPMVPSPTEPDCSTTVTPSSNKSARRPRLCAASRGASPAGPPPIMATPVRPKLNVTYFGVTHIGRQRHQDLRGDLGEDSLLYNTVMAAPQDYFNGAQLVSWRAAYDRR